MNTSACLRSASTRSRMSAGRFAALNVELPDRSVLFALKCFCSAAAINLQGQRMLPMPSPINGAHCKDVDRRPGSETLMIYLNQTRDEKTPNGRRPWSWSRCRFNIDNVGDRMARATACQIFPELNG